MDLLKNKKIIIVNIILLVLIVTLDMLYYFLKFSDMPWSIRRWFKYTASISFVLCCFINCILHKKYSINHKLNPYCVVLLIGQILAAIGDIILNSSFVLGVISFALGHIGFYIAYTIYKKFNLKDLLFIGAVFVFSFMILILYPDFNFEGLDVAIYFYAAIISCMVGTALSLACDKKKNLIARIVIAAGAVLFFFSDIMLVFCQFASGGEITDFLCLLTYYPAEFLLAFSTIVVLLPNKGKRESNNNIV